MKQQEKIIKERVEEVREKPLKIGNKLFSREMLEFTHMAVLQDEVTKALKQVKKQTEERVIGEMVKLNDKELHCGWKHDISQDSIERKLCNECYAINEFINKLKKKG